MADLRGDDLVKFGAGQRVRHGHADIVRLRGTNHGNGLLNLIPALTRITELKEQPNSDIVLREVPASVMNLLDSNALIHGVKDALRSGFRAHPDLGAASAFQSPRGVACH